MTFEGMSDLAVFAVLIGALALPALALMVWSWASRRKRRFNWTPEQDYDVEMRGESWMTPPFPVMKKRRDAPRWKSEPSAPRLNEERRERPNPTDSSP